MSSFCEFKKLSPAWRRWPHPHWDCWECIQNEGKKIKKKINKDNSKISLIWEFLRLRSASWKNTRGMESSSQWSGRQSYFAESESNHSQATESSSQWHCVESQCQSFSQRLTTSCGKTPAKCRRNSKIRNSCRQCPWALLMFTAAVDILTRKCGNEPLQL